MNGAAQPSSPPMLREEHDSHGNSNDDHKYHNNIILLATSPDTCGKAGILHNNPGVVLTPATVRTGGRNNSTTSGYTNSSSVRPGGYCTPRKKLSFPILPKTNGRRSSRPHAAKENNNQRKVETREQQERSLGHASGRRVHDMIDRIEAREPTSTEATACRVRDLVAQIEAKQRVIQQQHHTIHSLQQRVHFQRQVIATRDDEWQNRLEQEQLTSERILFNHLETIRRLTKVCTDYEEKRQGPRDATNNAKDVDQLQLALEAKEHEFIELQQQLAHLHEHHLAKIADYHLQVQELKSQLVQSPIASIKDSAAPKHVWFQIEENHKKNLKMGKSKENVAQMEALQYRLKNLLAHQQALFIKDDTHIWEC